ncbi:MAG: hypothetical protein AAGI91_10345 [Bacteroidota bacterium]
MRHLALLFLLTLAPAVLGQPEPSALYAGGDRQSVRVSLEGVYQRFTDEGQDLAEVSVPLGVYLPLGANVALGLNANYAAVSGSEIETLSAFGDVQFVASYFQPVGDGSVVLSLGFNANTGSSALTFEEFEAATRASQTVYDFRVPTFGQGLRVAPAVTYAFPLSDRVALGLGASYQYRGPYEPLADELDQYDPGEEVLLTGGTDLKVTDLSSVSLDVSYALNGTDSWGAIEYEPGNTVSAAMQYLQLVGRHEVRVLARYQSRGEGRLPQATVLGGTAAETAVPTQLLVAATGQIEVAPVLRLGVLARARIYGESALVPEGQTLTDLGLVPTVRVGERLHLTGRFVYTLGSFSGFTAGGGMSIAF